MKPIVVILGCLLLAGCVSSHSFYIMSRKDGASGTGVVPANGHGGGPITISIGGKDYKGQWIYMQTGGSVGFATATAFSGSASASGTGMFMGLPTGGNGTVTAAASDGSILRCVFNFSEWNLKGVGVCEDNHDVMYDLQIS